MKPAYAILAIGLAAGALWWWTRRTTPTRTIANAGTIVPGTEYYTQPVGTSWRGIDPGPTSGEKTNPTTPDLIYRFGSFLDLILFPSSKDSAIAGGGAGVTANQTTTYTTQ